MKPEKTTGMRKQQAVSSDRGLAHSNLLLAVAIALLWLAASSWAMWYFFYLPLRPFAKHDALAGIEHVRVSKGSSLWGEDELLALHFEDPDCTCTRYSRPHVEVLEKDYLELKHSRVRPGQAQDLPLDISFDRWVTTSPSVGIFDRSGNLRYFGPYNAGAVCGEGFDFFKQAVDGLGRDSKEKAPASDWKNLSAFGCFCDWPDFQGLDT